MQGYLKAIASLSNDEEWVTTTQISRYYKAAPASITEMLKKLAKNGYVNYLPRHGVILTPKGNEEAQKIIRKYTLLERLFSDILHLKADQARSQACTMEHAISDEVEEAIYHFLNYQAKRPDANIPPACDLPITTC
jgi:DtxR family Mn-dependent transcriptional regulator